MNRENQDARPEFLKAFEELMTREAATAHTR